MKKKILAALIAATLALSMSACDGSSDADKSATETTSDESALSAASVEEVDAGNATYGVIHITKEDLASVSYDDIKDYSENTISNMEYGWFTIDLGDGTGLVYSGCDPVMPVYCHTSESDSFMSTDTLGFVSNKDTYYVLIDDAKNPISDKTSDMGINGITDDIQ